MTEKISPLDSEFLDKEHVIVYQEGNLVYNGPWGELDDEYYDGT